jgi:hypothetical protein
MSIKYVTFHGATSGGGAISVPSLKVGDMVLFVGVTTQTDFAETNSHAGQGPFEAFISVDDEIQQISGFDLSANSYAAVLYRHG